MVAEFYSFTNITTNNKKAVLIINKTEQMDNERNFNLNINNQSVSIKYILLHESIHFLGIWMNMQNNQNFMVNKLKKIV